MQRLSCRRDGGRKLARASFLRRARILPKLFGVLLLLGLAVADSSEVAAQSDGPNRAALVVVHGDGRVVTRCVTFAEAQINGLELVQRAGFDLNLEASSMGATICRLDGEGCTYPQQSCFCQCEGESCVYWSYWRWQNGVWTYSNQGASNHAVTAGALEGWVWAADAAGQAKSPPATTFDAICTAPTPVATATETATDAAPPTLMADAGVAPTPTWTATVTPFATPSPLAATLPALAPAPLPAATATWTPPPPPTLPPTATPSAAPYTPGVEFTTAPRPLIEVFLADHKEIVAGQSVTLRWRVANAATVGLQADGRTVAIPTEGELLLAPRQNTTYSLVAANAGGAASTAMTIIVRAAPLTVQQSPAQPLPAQPLPAQPLPAQPPVQVTGETATPPTDAAEPLLPVLSVAASTALPALPPTATPAAIAAATLAPVVLATGSAPVEMGLAVQTSQPQTPVVAPMLFMLVGGLALLGLPLMGLALILVFVALRRS